MVLLPVCLAGCATPEQQIETASKIKTTDDDFRPFKEFVSGEIRSSNQLGLGAKQLVARIDRKSGALTTLLQFEIAYTSSHRRTYEQARNNRAETLPFHSIQRHSRCTPGKDCIYDELFIITLPEADLRRAATSGYRLKVFARNGPEILIDVPKELIVNLFAKVDSERAAPKAPVPAAAAPTAPAAAASVTATAPRR